MRQSSVCATAIATAEPDTALPASGFDLLNVAKAWEFSTGHGVAVAVIDTGVQSGARISVRGGGDYIGAGDGLSDCDAHGTVVASIIAAAPRGRPMPPPMPPRPAFGAAAGTATRPQPPTAAPSPPDGVAGVAPHATVISIRQSSRAYALANPGPGDLESLNRTATLSTLARAVVHAANLGAKVINLSIAACVPAAEPIDQSAVGAAVWYAATVKDAVVVAAAGNVGEDGCTANPDVTAAVDGDSRGWHGVRTISTPSWFSDYVLSVGAVDATGVPLSSSLAGPWVGIAAPGTGITGLSPQEHGAVNAYPPMRPGEPAVPLHGSGFAAAYVSGVAALVRAKYPELSAQQVVRRLQLTAHNPPGGIDNRVGHGVVDPVAALTFAVPPGERGAPGATSRVITPPAPPPAADRRARTVAIAITALAALGALIALVGAGTRRLR